MPFQWHQLDPDIARLQGDRNLASRITEHYHGIALGSRPQPFKSLPIAKNNSGASAPQLDLHGGVISPGLILVDVRIHVVGIDDDDVVSRKLLPCRSIDVRFLAIPAKIPTRVWIIDIVNDHAPVWIWDVNMGSRLTVAGCLAIEKECSMTFWAKVLIIVTLVLSIAFAAASGVIFAKRTNYRGLYEQAREQAAKKQQELNTRIEDLEGKLSAETARAEDFKSKLHNREVEFDR